MWTVIENHHPPLLAQRSEVYFLLRQWRNRARSEGRVCEAKLIDLKVKRVLRGIMSEYVEKAA